MQEIELTFVMSLDCAWVALTTAIALPCQIYSISFLKYNEILNQIWYAIAFIPFIDDDECHPSPTIKLQRTG
jgi:RNAse (barnase) inhibitor barstar